MQGETVEVDPRFSALVPDRSQPELLYDQCTFTEGPVWFADLQCLLWSDIPNNRILRWTPKGRSASSVPTRISRTATPATARDGWSPASTACGACRAPRSTAASRHRRQLRGKAPEFPERRRGEVGRLDLVHRSRLWPEAEPPRHAEGAGWRQRLSRRSPIRQVGGRCRRFRQAQRPDLLARREDALRRRLRRSRDGPDLPSHIRAFRVADDGTLSGGEVFATTIGIPDGLRVDTSGQYLDQRRAGRKRLYAGRRNAGADRVSRRTSPTSPSEAPGGDQIFVTTGARALRRSRSRPRARNGRERRPDRAARVCTFFHWRNVKAKARAAAYV